MSRQDPLVHSPGHTETQHSTKRNPSYCTECLERFFHWKAFERKFARFHRDIYELMDCGDRCELCKYICSLFGRPHLQDYLARAVDYNEKPVEPLPPNAANIMVRHHDGYRSLLLISRDPKTAPTVDIWDVTRKPILDQNGHFDHAVLQINPMHHVTTRDDRKAIVIYTEAGTLLSSLVTKQLSISDSLQGERFTGPSGAKLIQSTSDFEAKRYVNGLQNARHIIQAAARS